tara:strand:- start:27125 stop:28258 length:1134 start_codon:yes stop_codon:yes gene_type:complete
MTILGTRPEIIRLSRVMSRLDNLVEHIIVHTGQNYDYNLNEIFFNDLGVRKPDYFLSVNGGSLGKTLGNILSKTEEVLMSEKPDSVLILGDTNSAFASIMARRLHIPVYHMEAGNRSFDLNVPEETNRRLVDHISDFNLVYTEHARKHLLSEGLEHRRIILTGSPMREVLEHYRQQIKDSNILERLKLQRRKYLIASIHREENVDQPERLRELIEGFSLISEKFNMPLILSTHPRTAKRLENFKIPIDSSIKLMDPFGFHEYNSLQLNSFCAISDSGTIAEESSILGFPAITPRDAIERPEALDVGCLIQTGINRYTMINAIEAITNQFYTNEVGGFSNPIPEDYCINNTSERVVNLIIGTSRLSNSWDGIRSLPRS